VPSRGIRNHNPGNIRRDRTRWKGQAEVQTDPAFVVFTAPEWGLRAMARVLRNYQTKHGLRTVRAIISRWAPQSENDVDAYVRSVAVRMGVDPEAALSLADADLLADLIAAIVRHENGCQPYDQPTIQKAIELAEGS